MQTYVYLVPVYEWRLDRKLWNVDIVDLRGNDELDEQAY